VSIGPLFETVIDQDLLAGFLAPAHSLQAPDAVDQAPHFGRSEAPTVFDLDDRYRITGAEHLVTGYKKDGKVARWQGIYDDKGRVMVTISLNSDIGDSWEWSDTPEYPLKFSDLGMRLGVNYVVYAMTH